MACLAFWGCGFADEIPWASVLVVSSRFAFLFVSIHSPFHFHHMTSDISTGSFTLPGEAGFEQLTLRLAKK
jgi:hypothetical protein